MSGIVVKSAKPPTIEIDPSAGAAYVRFEAGTVHSTVECGPTMTADLDRLGNVIGVEMLGLNAFTVQIITKRLAPIRTPKIDWNKAKFTTASSMTPTDYQHA